TRRRRGRSLRYRRRLLVTAVQSSAGRISAPPRSARSAGSPPRRACGRAAPPPAASSGSRARHDRDRRLAPPLADLVEAAGRRRRPALDEPPEQALDGKAPATTCPTATSRLAQRGNEAVMPAALSRIAIPNRRRQNRAMLELFPDTARVEDGMLTIGGVRADVLAREHGTPLLVYDEATVRARARAYREAAPEAFVCYGTKAFPNVAVLRLLADEGVGADVSTLGELRFALAAGVPGERLVVHGNNKSDEELGAAAGLGALVVLDSLEEVDRARDAGVARTLIRFTPGIEADTHAAIRTAHHGSKFGLPA